MLQFKTRPALIEAAASNSWSYLFYRMRLSFINFNLKSIFYFVDLYLVFLFFGSHVLFTYSLVRLSLRFVSETWWATLEGFRIDLRKRKELSVLSVFPIKLGVPIFLGVSLSLLSTLLFAQIFTGFPIVLIFIPLCLRLVSEVIHSTLNAFQRVYRSFWSFLFLEAIHTLLLCLASSWKGHGLLLVALTFSLICFLVQLYYLQKALTRSGLVATYRIRLRDFKKTFSFFSSQHALLLFVKGFIEAMFFVALYSFNPTIGNIPALALCALLLPLLTTSDAWLRSFYPDLSKLASWQTRGFYNHFSLKLLAFSGAYFCLLFFIWAFSIHFIFPFVNKLALLSAGAFFISLALIKGVTFHFYFHYQLTKWKSILPLSLAKSYEARQGCVWKTSIQYFSHLNDKGIRTPEDYFSHPAHLYRLMQTFKVESFFVKKQQVIFYSASEPPLEVLYRIAQGLIQTCHVEKVLPLPLTTNTSPKVNSKILTSFPKQKLRYLMSYMNDSFWGKPNTHFSLHFEAGSITHAVLKKLQASRRSDNS